MEYPLLVFFLMLQLIYNYQYVFYKNNPFPIDNTSRQIEFITDNQTALNLSSIVTQSKISSECVASAIKDSVCNEINNNEKCQYDGGDCCQGSCMETCKTLPSGQCKCGESSYNCKSESASCYNCIHGTCVSNITNCFVDTERLLNGINSCYLNNFTQGNSNTSDYYCGKDPFKNVTHFGNNPTFHYPGCGFNKVNCTTNPCCEVVLMNNDTSETCDSKPKERYIWDSVKKVFIASYEDCLSYYRKCFQENAVGVGRGQCCECDMGWGGAYCDVPLCSRCQHGTCVGMEICLCEANYKGVYCDQPQCDKCEKGICVGPNQCECYYGYTGAACDEPTRTPLCVNGQPAANDKCICQADWSGELCEIKICNPSCGKGICRDDGTCSCPVNYVNSNDTSLCDQLISCEVFSPFCQACTEFECTQCKEGFTLFDDPSKPRCAHPMIIEPHCDYLKNEVCMSCEPPFQLLSNKCLSYGQIEMSSIFYSAIETDKTLEVTINRYYGNYSTCTVFYELFFTQPNPDKTDSDVTASIEMDYQRNPLNKMEIDSGMLVFSNGQSSKVITLNVFSDNLLNFHTNQFEIMIFNPIGGCYLGDIEKSTIEIFENETLVDINYSSSSIKNILNTNGEYNIFANIHFIQVEAYSYKASDVAKTDGTDNFLIILLTNGMVEMLDMMTYSSYNKYSIQLSYSQLKSPTTFIGKKSIIVQNCIKGNFLMSYFDTAGFIPGDPPYFVRNVNTIYIDNFYSNKNYYSVEWTTVFLNRETALRQYVFQLAIAKNDKIELYVNDIKIEMKSKVISSEVAQCTFSQITISPKIPYYQIKIKFIHTSGKSTISHSFTKDNDLNVYHLGEGNFTIFSCTDLPSSPPYILNIM